MANLFDDWAEAHRAPEPVEVARRSAGELTVDMLTAREEFREAARLLEEGETASGLGLGAFTAATFVFPWGRGGRLAMGGAQALRGAGAARGPALRAARGVGDADIDGLAVGATSSGPSAPEPAISARAASRDVEAVDERNVAALELILGKAGVSVPDTEVSRTAVRALGPAARAGGFTWDPRTGRTSFDEGFSVAFYENYEIRPQSSVNNFSSMDALNYLAYSPPQSRGLSMASGRPVVDLLAENPENMVGAWVAPDPTTGRDTVWLDVSRVVATREEAFRVGGARNQLEIYDFAGDRSIPVPEEFRPGGVRYDASAAASDVPGLVDVPEGGVSVLLDDALTVAPVNPARTSRLNSLRQVPIEDEGNVFPAALINREQENLRLLNSYGSSLPLARLQADAQTFRYFNKKSPAIDSFENDFVETVVQGGNVIWGAENFADFGVIDGKDLRGLFVIPARSQDFVDSKVYTLSASSVSDMSDGRRYIMNSLDSFADDFVANYSPNDRLVLYGFNGNRSADIAGDTSFDIYAIVGSLAASEEDAFRLAAQRSISRIYNAETGDLVDVPRKYFADLGAPPNAGVNRVREIADTYPELNNLAETHYMGRGEEDAALKRIYEIQGFDAPTELITPQNAARLVAEGHMPLYRGVSFKFAALQGDARKITSRSLPDGWESKLPQGWDDFRFQEALERAIQRGDVQWQDTDFWTIYANIMGENLPKGWLTPQRTINDFAVGNYFAGSGSHGSGTYMTPNLQRAMGYAEIYPKNPASLNDGVVMGAVLNPHANIMGPNEYYSLLRSTGFAARGSSQVGIPNIWADKLSGFRKIVTKEIIDDDGLRALAQVADASTVPTEQYSKFEINEVFADMGRLIAAMGYDAYIPHGSVYRYGKPEYVILNRQAIKVVNQPIEPIRFESGNIVALKPDPNFVAWLGN